jgi:peptidoglycan L-alanyl-D-glutamate endopeptidase CwlK
MAFRLSQRSLDKLDGVHPDMVAVVKRAIELTDVDFGVTYGVRTLAEQKELYESGRSQTMKSKHLIQGDGYSHAVDLVAYFGSNVSWELNVYDNICDAMAQAAEELEVPIKWGAAWSEGDIRYYDDTAEDAMNAYIDLRRSQGRRPFIDAPHFELMMG